MGWPSYQEEVHDTRGAAARQDSGGKYHEARLEVLPAKDWVLDFLATTDVGRRVPAPVEEDARSEASEGELRERRERKRRGEQRLRSWGPRSRNRCFSPRLPSWHLQKRSRGGAMLSFVLSFVISLVQFLPQSWDRPGRRARGSLKRAAIAGTAAGKRSKSTPR
jgi:hypothetical protein